MHRVGPYNIPFPYAPYPLQEHAMTALRDFLKSTSDAQPANGSTTTNALDGAATSIAVLESPTGTGKSQMLLNGVLSHLFEPVCGIGSDDDVVQAAEGRTHAGVAPLDASSAPSPHQQTPKPTTLEDVLKQRQLEEEMDRLRREREARVRAQRRQLRQARRLMHVRQQTDARTGGDGGEAFLLAQDPIAWCAEQSVVDSGGGGRSSFSSSSSLSSSSSSDSDGETSGDDAEGAVGGNLATLVPLRKPKVYVASRTHTQLQQLMEDLQRTAFARFPLRAASSDPSQATPTHRRLHAVHVAGRQHLCINARILQKAGASGGGEMLNHYCREAMHYERSKEGRSARKQQQRRAQQQGTSFAADSKHAAHMRGLQDIEEVGLGADKLDAEDKGCVYCSEVHLRALLDFLKEEEAAQQRADDAANDRSSIDTCDSSSLSASLHTMERLRHLGRELQACPYLATRLLLRGADVAFIPYGYLLDEGQRAALLGGVTTNPATAAEAEAVGLHGAAPMEDGGLRGEAREGQPGTAASSSSLGAVLYHRRQRVTATAAFHQRRRQQQQQQQEEKEKRKKSTLRGDGGAHATRRRDDEKDEEDEVWHLMARSAPPSVVGDILVFDEAHNIADHCRSTSAVSLSPWHLQLSEGLLQAYLDRYETRLLTRNKQRLRELIRFIGKLVKFCASVAATASAPQVFALHNFLFEAGIDSVDVYALLIFLVDSQLLMKLQGFVGYCVEKEAERLQDDASAAVAASNASSRQQLHTGGGGGKRQRSVAVDGGGFLGERQRQRRFLDSFSADTPLSTPAGTAHSTSSDQHERAGVKSAETAASASPSSSSSLFASAPLTSLLQRHAHDTTRQRAVVTDALQRVERLLSVLYVSDATSTRVIWTPTSATSAETDVGKEGVLKLIQLEPGTHTFTPLAQEAKAVVLAGGTMQPLAFTCGPLLPANPTECSTTSTTTTTTTPLPSPGGTDLPVRLISEGHVVAPTSVRVFTLGTGPSKVRMEFSQHALNDAAAGRMLAEVGCTLLNLTRVLPPAGAICFFASYEAMDRMVAALQSNGYFAAINAVKRIFCETRGGRGKDGGAAEMLQQYQSWIYGDTTASVRRGALLLAVMGGRLSEGINFADDLGRAVVVVGMPYANPTDVELQLNLHHIASTRLHNTVNGSCCRVEGQAGGATPNAPFASPAEWGLYMDAMMRTVNQCIGRCIRHSGDYAAIVLLDARYGERADVRRRVSAWLQPSMQVCHSFGECFSGLRTFFDGVAG